MSGPGDKDKEVGWPWEIPKPISPTSAAPLLLLSLLRIMTERAWGSAESLGQATQADRPGGGPLAPGPYPHPSPMPVDSAAGCLGGRGFCLPLGSGLGV